MGRVIAVVLAVAVASGAALAGCGTAAAPQSSSSPSPSAIARPHNQADITFAQDMIPHHTQAVTMSWMAMGRAASPQVQGLADRIRSAQQPEIDQMKGWLDGWNATPPADAHHHMGNMDHGGGAMPGMISGDQLNQLGQLSGAAFDRMFLQMMITHHQGAIAMAKTELGSGQSPEARQLAQRVIDAQQHEITEMQALLGG
ncbi:MAG TPA: DUF305 domain-containing protein [Pseudonocardiaceae bacterium]|nr:DUF305 domain-containing protein [Pseudonocardiaceae bacterium]